MNGANLEETLEQIKILYKHLYDLDIEFVLSYADDSKKLSVFYRKICIRDIRRYTFEECANKLIKVLLDKLNKRIYDDAKCLENVKSIIQYGIGNS